MRITKKEREVPDLHQLPKKDKSRKQSEKGQKAILLTDRGETVF